MIISLSKKKESAASIREDGKMYPGIVGGSIPKTRNEMATF